MRKLLLLGMDYEKDSGLATVDGFNEFFCGMD
jgi:hypothetical protein